MDCSSDEINPLYHPQEDGDDVMDPLFFNVWEGRICRICLEEDNPNDFIAPCKCKGGSKWVHRRCLDQWRATNRSDIAFSQCTECLFIYHMDAVEVSGRKRLKYCLYVSRDMCLTTTLVQLLIALLGLLLWLVLVHIPYDENEDEWGHFVGGCQTRICNIGLCYIGGLLLLLLSLGLFGSAVLCCHRCSIESSIAAVSQPPRRRMRSYQTEADCCWLCYYSTDPVCWTCSDCHCGCPSTDLDCGSFDGHPVALIVLLGMGIVLAAIGFVVGCIIAAACLQRILQAHMWVLQKRRLVEEYRVRDLADLRNIDDLAIIENGVSLAVSPSASTTDLPEEDAARLEGLGLMM